MPLAFTLLRRRPVEEPPVDFPLAIPAGGVTSASIPSNARWGSTADNADALGVNTHFQPKPGTPYANVANSVADLAALRVRHIRDSMAGSFLDSRSYEWRAGYMAINARNQNVPVGEHPIFLSIILPGSHDWQPWTHRTRETLPHWEMPEWLTSIIGGSQHRFPSWGGFIPSGTTSNPNALTPNPWNTADGEFPWWDMFAMFQGANEMTHNGTETAQDPTPTGGWWNNSTLTQADEFLQVLMDELAARPTQAAYGAAGGNDIVTVDGIRPGSRAASLPIAGPSIINNTISNRMGDWTSKSCYHLGDGHPYHPGDEPTHEQMHQELLGTFGSPTCGLYNGNLRNPPNNAAAKPWICSEVGHITSGMDQTDHEGSSAYWPSPQDIQAKYLIKEWQMFWWLGVRRFYIYTFYDEGTDGASENSFGIVNHNRTFKPAAHAIRNMFELIGFSEAPPGSRGPIPFSMSGFVAQGGQYSTGSNTVVGGGGTWRHVRMPAGTVRLTTADRLDVNCLQQSANTWILVLNRQCMQWDRAAGNWNIGSNVKQQFANVAGGRFTPNTQAITLTFSGGISTAQIARPCQGLTGTTSSPFWTWSDPTDGRDWTSAGSGGLSSISGGTAVTVTDSFSDLVLVKVTT
jgi:hypothetical protein